MDIGIISTRYAKTLLRFATDNKEEDRVYQEMTTLAAAFQKVPELLQTLTNPVLDNAKKSELLICAACGISEVSYSTNRFVDLIVRNHRASMIHFIALTFCSLYLKSKGIIRGILTVPVSVSASTSQKLRHMVETRTKSNVEFTVNVDPKIEGGFILQYDTYRLDASLRTQLLQLRRSLS
jgi:ATP synthase F1, delta subunit